MSIYKNSFERIKETFYYPDNENIFSRISVIYATALGAAKISEVCFILNEVIKNENNEFTDEDIETAKEIKDRINNYENLDSSTK